MRARRIALTLGDPRGVGPEVALGAMQALDADPNRPQLFVFGTAGSETAEYADRYVALADSAHAVAEPGAFVASALEAAVGLAQAGEVDAIVTGPIDKAALHAAGHTFPGHTEMLAALTATVHVAMLMAAEQTAMGGPLRVTLATTHIPLKEVPRRLTAELLVRSAQLTVNGLREGWGIGQPRIALCALNPHASEQGLFGDEEETVYAPAIDELASAGVLVSGPIPADTVFVRAVRGEFDAVVAPYHDVGMAAFKTASFGHGVNVTLGLPFVRTSPDHGTAFDIAGKGIADWSSMLEAIRLADRLAERRNAAEVS